MNNPMQRIAVAQTAPLSPARARVEEFKLRKEQRFASARAMFGDYQFERDAVAAIERAVPHDSPFRGKTLAELANVTVEKEPHVRGRAEDDLAFQLGECRRSAVHRERMARMREAGDRLGTEAAALNELIARCERYLDTKEAQ